MAQEHVEQQVIERALENEPASDDEPKLQKVDRKQATRKPRNRVELLELNTMLIETYRELDRATRAAKDIAANLKVALQQTRIATELWQTTDTQRAKLERKLNMVPQAPAPILPPPSSDQTTQAETPVATIPADACFVSIETQTEADNATTIQQLEEDVATYKAIADKAKEQVDEASQAADQREAELRKTITDQSTQLRDADEKVTTTISPFQDIVTTQIATITKELKEMQATSAIFL